MMEVPGSSETSILTTATRRNIPEDGILHSHRSENLSSYMREYSLILGLDFKYNPRPLSNLDNGTRGRPK
jgi:hypothetical protein